jgi:hypothetical protein
MEWSRAVSLGTWVFSLLDDGSRSLQEAAQGHFTQQGTSSLPQGFARNLSLPRHWAAWGISGRSLSSGVEIVDKIGVMGFPDLCGPRPLPGPPG